MRVVPLLLRQNAGLDALQNLPLFHYVERESLVDLAHRAELKKFQTNTLILR